MGADIQYNNLKPQSTVETVETLQSALLKMQIKLDAVEQRLRETAEPLSAVETTAGVTKESVEALIKSHLDAAVLPETQDALPDCVELMARPHSPYADGYFITRHTTSHKWTPRHDGSRQFDLTDICQLKRYTADEAKQCLANQHINFIGDSLTRYQFFSLAYFIEKGQYPPRFGLADGDECTRVDEHGVPHCSPPGDPNVCMEGDWWRIYGPKSWYLFFANVGGGADGGMFGGRMEESTARDQDAENEVYVGSPGPDGEQTVLSFFMEVGWGVHANPIKGFNFTGCAFNGTCRDTYEKVMHRNKNGTMDFEQVLVDALNPANGFLRHVFRPPNVSIYNRGMWGLLREEKASAVFPLFYNWTGREKGRCFFKSTTGRPDPLSFRDHELGKIRGIIFDAGCSFIDYGHITRDFATLHWRPEEKEKSGVLSVDDERFSIYWDKVHYMPWVYEELNNVLLNVLCNYKQANATVI